MKEQTEKYPFKEAVSKEIEVYKSMKKELILKYPFTATPFRVLTQGKWGDGLRTITSIDDLTSDQYKIHYKGRVIDARIEALEDILKWTYSLDD